MAESRSHMDLVQLMSRYIIEVMHIERGFILHDTPDSKSSSKPPIIESYRPDIYAKSKKVLVIGDAKTDDWGSRHSMQQYKAFLSECKEYKHQAYFLLAVPWYYERSARLRLRSTFSEVEYPGVNISVLSNMWRWNNAENSPDERTINCR